jgi:hypothetical protein
MSISNARTIISHAGRPLLAAVALGGVLAALAAGALSCAQENPQEKPEPGATYYVSPSFLLGINPINYLDGPTERDVETAASLGAKSIRIWVNWRKIEPTKGKRDWSSLDKIVAQNEQRGLEPWFLVAGAPQHACRGGELDEQKDRLCPPRIEPYKVFLTELVQRYRGRVHYYEIWNEPDDEYYWITGPDAGEYAELLRVSHAIIKAIDNEAHVVMAATAGTNLPYLRQVLEYLGDRPVFDAIASHPYRPSSEPPYYMTVGPDEHSWRELPGGGGAGVEVNLKEELLLYKDLLRRYGYKDVPHWITEFGYPGHGGRASPAYLTLQQQADFARRTIELLREDPELKFVKGVFWWTDRDLNIDLPDPIPLEYFAYFGLIASDGAWKPAANVFKELSAKTSVLKQVPIDARGDPPHPNSRTVTIDTRASMGPGSASVLADFLVVQGVPVNFDDSFETGAWAQLGLAGLWPLLNDQGPDAEGNMVSYLGEGGIFVMRANAKPAAANVRGPFGPKRDLWLDINKFDRYMDLVHARLRIPKDRTAFGIWVVPRALQCAPKTPMDNFNVTLYPCREDEWQAVLREAARYIAERGYRTPWIEFFQEPESYFSGKNRKVGSHEASRDLARLYILTQNAMQPALPGLKLAAPSYSSVSHRHLGAPAPDTADFFQTIRDLTQASNPSFRPTAVSWQGYFYPTPDGAYYGPERLIWAVKYAERVLRDTGFCESKAHPLRCGDIPQNIHGWNHTFWGEVRDWGSNAIPSAEVLRREAAYQASQIIDFVTHHFRYGTRFNAQYYTWNFDVAPNEKGCNIPVGRQSIVQTVHDGTVGGGDDGIMTCDIPASQVACARRPYRSLEAFRLLRDGKQTRIGEMLSASVGGVDASATLRAIAARDAAGDPIRVMLVNRNAESIGPVLLRVTGLTPGIFDIRIRSITTVRAPAPGGELCADWLDVSEGSVVSDTSGVATLALNRSDSGPLVVEFTRR